MNCQEAKIDALLAEKFLQVDLKMPRTLRNGGKTGLDLYILGQVATRIFGPNAFLGDGPWCAWSRTLNL